MSRFAEGLGALGVAILAALAAIAGSLGLIALSGGSAFEAASALLDGAFGGSTQTAGTVSKMVPLIFVALGWIMAISAARINVGFEGQILVSGILAAVVGVSLTDVPTAAHLPLALLAGVLGGAAYAGLAAVLWARRRVSEVISTLMLNFVAIQLLSWLLRGPLQEPSRTFPRSRPIAESARWPSLLGSTSLTWDLFLALACVALVYLVLRKAAFGFQMKVVGANPALAQAVGIGPTRVGVLALLISGGFGGLAGTSLILGGESISLADNFSAGYGFEGIVVALLARNNPVAVLPAALFFAALRQGSGLVEARVGVSADLVIITQGIVILLVAGTAFLLDQRRARRIDNRRPASDTAAGASGMLG